jgi:hypothetical protein
MHKFQLVVYTETCRAFTKKFVMEINAEKTVC